MSLPARLVRALDQLGVVVGEVPSGAPARVAPAGLSRGERALRRRAVGEARDLLDCGMPWRADEVAFLERVIDRAVADGVTAEDWTRMGDLYRREIEASEAWMTGGEP